MWVCVLVHIAYIHIMPRLILFTSNASTVKMKDDACKHSDQSSSWILDRGKMLVSSPPHPGQFCGPRFVLFIGLQETVYPGDTHLHLVLN